MAESQKRNNLVEEADAPTVQADIDAGADLEARSEDSSTPLMYAAAYNENAAVVQALIDAGADATATNRGGKTAWDLIQENESLRSAPLSANQNSFSCWRRSSSRWRGSNS